MISIDFIEQLPLSSGYTSILVVVDRLSKQGIFIATHDTITSSDLAWLFVIHVFSKHGVPAHVTCDRGSEFVSRFFRSLGTALDMKLHFTSGYHPEGDGQTECTNQTLEQYIWVFCNYQQDNWFDLLPLGSSRTITPRAPQRKSLHSMPTRAITRTSPFTQSKT